jgi:outer membrane lipoprotein-sorting protein
MVRQFLLLMRRRMVWLILLLAIWLFCSGQVQAGELASRLQN